MRKLLKNALPIFIISLSFTICGFSVTCVNLGLYYIAAYITYLGIISFYEYKSCLYLKKIKNIAERIDILSTSIPEPIIKFREWLEREKFFLRNDSNGIPYLQSSVATIRYSPKSAAKIVVSPTKINTEEYLVYRDNEELKMKFEDYLAYLTKKDEDLTKYENRYLKTNANSAYNSNERFVTLNKAMILCIRFQGYIFLLISLTKVQDTSISNSVKVLTFITYIIIDDII